MASRELIANALFNWANYVETGDPLRSLNDLKEEHRAIQVEIGTKGSSPSRLERLLKIGSLMARQISGDTERNIIEARQLANAVQDAKTAAVVLDG